MNAQTIAASVRPAGVPELTKHAIHRSTSRGLAGNAIDAVLAYGRVVHVRGAAIYVIGRKEVKRYADYGVDLTKYEGVQVVCNSSCSAIMTVYRNRDLRGLRPRLRRSRH